MQFNPKKKRSAIKQHERVTGGGRKCPETLTQFEETVTNLIGEVPGDGTFRHGRFAAAVSPPAVSPLGQFAAAVSPPAVAPLGQRGLILPER
jgi:hypothetical protein